MHEIKFTCDGCGKSELEKVVAKSVQLGSDPGYGFYSVKKIHIIRICGKEYEICEDCFKKIKAKEDVQHQELKSFFDSLKEKNI